MPYHNANNLKFEAKHRYIRNYVFILIRIRALYITSYRENNVASHTIRTLSQACRPIDTRAIAPEVILLIRDGQLK